MQKLSVTLLIFVSGTLLCCRHHTGNTNITLRESDNQYEMEADFPDSRTRDVEKYMDEQIGAENHLSFINTKMDAQLTLDDHTSFYLKKLPGHLEMVLEKEKNSQEGYARIKSMCEGIKEVIGDKKP